MSIASSNRIGSTPRCNQHDFNQLSVSKKADFLAFQKMLLETFRVKDLSQLPIQKIETAYKIFYSTENLVLPAQEECHFLLLMACLVRLRTKEKVGFISPTDSHWMNAMFVRDKFMHHFCDSLGLEFEKHRFVCILPGKVSFNALIRECNVLFMHGKDYSEFLPIEWKGRKIIENLPLYQLSPDPVPSVPSSDMNR